MTKPTENNEWAESADPLDVSDPVAERSSGYAPNETLPNSQLNWLFRMITRWIQYLTDWTDLHNHKGGVAEDGSMPRLSIKNELNYAVDPAPYGGSANGHMYIETSGGGEHHINHVSDPGDTARFESGEVFARDNFLLDSETDGTVIRDDTLAVGSARVAYIEPRNVAHSAGIKAGALRVTDRFDDASADHQTQFQENESLHVENLVKAKINVTLEYDGSSWSVSARDSEYNIDTISYPAAANYIEVTFNHDFIPVASNIADYVGCFSVVDKGDPGLAFGNCGHQALAPTPNGTADKLRVFPQGLDGAGSWEYYLTSAGLSSGDKVTIHGIIL